MRQVRCYPPCLGGQATARSPGPLGPPRLLRIIGLAAASLGCFSGFSLGQSDRKPTRVAPPIFEAAQFEDLFFDDPTRVLQGNLPGPTSAQAAPKEAVAPSPAPAPQNSDGWNQLISPNSLEDLVKGSKLRLDRIVTTPAAFKGGGYNDARREYSLQAVLFAIIEAYPGEVRWQNSAATARELFARVAANTKIGSDQVYQEAKQRQLDLSDLIGGTALTTAARSEVDWSNLIDRAPLMQLLEWSHEENLSKLVANPREFQDNLDAVQRYAELIAVLGKVALAEEMPDAGDSEYAGYAQEMIDQARQVVLAVQTKNPDLARQASSQIGQSCATCHDSYR